MLIRDEGSRDEGSKARKRDHVDDDDDADDDGEGSHHEQIEAFPNSFLFFLTPFPSHM